VQIVHQRKRTRAYRFSGNTPAFPAQWFYGLFRALPGERLCCHRRQRDAKEIPGIIANLTPASGRQDHTTSPSAAPPFVRATKARDDAAASTASRTNVRDDRDTPLVVGRDALDMSLICVRRKAKNIFKQGWTRFC
jgi:hypothetical protein